MRHLLSHTVYGGRELFGEDPYGFLGSIGADGIELLTSYEEPDPWYRGLAESVHLPYATDWLAAWEGRPYDLDDDCALFYMFGRSRDDVVSNVTRAIELASSLSPAYGVFHAANGDIPELCMRRHSRDDRQVLSDLAEMVNTVVAGFPGGEPAAGNRIAEFQNETAARCGTVFKPAGEYFIPYQSAQRRLLDQGKDFCFPVLGREGHGCGVQSADRVE